MKIGILADQIDLLTNWELELIAQVFALPGVSIAVIGLNANAGKEEKQHKSFFAKLKPNNFIFKYQLEFEDRFFTERAFPNRDEVISRLKTIPSVALTPIKKGFVDFFPTEEGEKLSSYELDILLRFGFNIIKGGILDVPRLGIWSLHHGDNDVNRGGPAGFWEIILKNDYIGVTLQQLTHELDGGNIIEKGFYNIDWSFIKNKRLITQQSINLVTKNIRLAQRGIFEPKRSKTYMKPLYRWPSFPNTLRYIANFYTEAFKKALRMNLAKHNISQTDTWAIYQGKGNILHSPLFRLKKISFPKNEFWADPFLLNYKGVDYIFFENFPFNTSKGVISCGRLDGNLICDVVTALELDYHLSYPHVFEEEGELFMIPEASNAYRLEIFRCVEFPQKWELYSSGFEGEYFADPNYFKDAEGRCWISFNKGYLSDLSAELHLFEVDSLKLKSIKPHLRNPVIVDTRIARNAGPHFYHEGKLYRPSQLNIKGKYGLGLNINEVKKMSLEDYEEEVVETILPEFMEGITGIHHLHQLGDRFFVDIASK